MPNAPLSTVSRLSKSCHHWLFDTLPQISSHPFGFATWERLGYDTSGGEAIVQKRPGTTQLAVGHTGTRLGGRQAGGDVKIV